MEDLEEIGRRILGAAIKVHSRLGPGLLESVYQRCLAYELQGMGLMVQCEAPVPVTYDDVFIDVGFRADMIVEDRVIVENKTVEKIAPLHEAQLLTYLRLKECQLGFLLNWNTVLMKDGIRRLVNGLPQQPESTAFNAKHAKYREGRQEKS